ncbi:endonuclease/exonuclease/phosphatase family protein [Schaalia sp. 19OD2882]|uniref:exodeoxyribonuclease III n=1 Tax=Schaalia sp. 19OD2882 TaxID=2794089 RepID=UPI001C1EBA9E|nr:exodeoxyribonuclease III [Schaalia sp. 19OD2882]QWW19322.1 endonuclease/exonuclease/phosphatase family protein [Schaalia sp. 19OD2882]
MRIATWNVNSLRTRVERVIDFLDRSGTDVLAMQEIKCRPDQLPTAPFEEAGYEVVAHGLDQWNGVAVATRLPVEDVRVGFDGQPAFGDPPKVEARALGVKVRLPAGTRPSLTVWSLYVPNGREVDHPHYAYKLKWLARLRTEAATWLAEAPEALTALVGDWNIAPEDHDVWDMAAFEGATHVSPAEREAFAAFAADGWVEATRGRADNYTYWDYQKLRFPRNEGMRIDFVLGSPAFEAAVSGAFIDRDERKGKGASDHVPVLVDLDL